MQFNGTAIYVFFTLVNYQGDGVTTLTSANFSIDGEPPSATFTYTPNMTSNAVLYKALVFSQTGLPNTLHELNISTTGNVSMYLNFDYAIYTTDDDTVLVSSSTMSVSSTNRITQQSSTSTAVQKSTTANSAKTLVGAIVGGIAGGIAIFVFVIFLLSCWHRRRNPDALQRDGGNGDPASLTRSLNIGRGPPAVSAPRMAQLQSQIRSKPPIVAPQSNQTGSNSGYSGQGGAGPSHWDGSRKFLGNINTTGVTSNGMLRSGHEDHHNSHPNTQEQTREEVRHERQEELDYRLRVVQREMEQVTESTLTLRRQRTLTHTGEEVSVSDMRMEVMLMREQIALLRSQQRSAWALGLSDDPPPGYTPMETRRT